MSITQALLGPLLGNGSPQPLITHYDDATGARVELSRATVANWAAKTANWLVDELDLEPGAPVAVTLPAHWQTAGVLLGSWWCGAHVTDEPRGAEMAFVPASDPGTGTGAHTVAAVGLDALGAPLRELPGGVVDYISDIRAYGDNFTPITPVPPGTPALLDSTVQELLGRARERAGVQGISPSDRVLSTMDWEFPVGIVDNFLAILAAQASLVQCTSPDPAKLEQRRIQERITFEIGTGRLE